VSSSSFSSKRAIGVGFGLVGRLSAAPLSRGAGKIWIDAVMLDPWVHATGLDRNELGTPLVAAGLRSAAEHSALGSVVVCRLANPSLSVMVMILFAAASGQIRISASTTGPSSADVTI
jgi:hypothetical protein